ncbi:MAG: response regulator transcription factor [Sulfurospirillum sp.]
MKLLIIEDDENILSLLNKGFSELGYIIDSGEDGEAGEYLATMNHYDVIVLDWMMPAKSGIDVLKSLRQKNIKTPVIMLTAKNDIDDRVTGLMQGADDYLQKPFSFKELNARIQALYRRSIDSGSNIIELKDFGILDMEAKVIKKKDKEIALSKKEYELLTFLIKHNHSIVSNTMIEEQLWSNESYINSNVIQVTMYNLRKKIGKKLVKSFRGLGYKLEI